MARKTEAEIPAVETAEGLRRCIGSTRYGIEPHEAPIEEFPRQPSQKDGLGRMCKTHWNAYTAGLARDAKARKAAEGDATVDAAELVADESQPTEPPPTAKRRRIASTGQGNRYAESTEGAGAEAG